VPPHAAAVVPVANVSAENVPPKGISMWVWASMPPGEHVLPGGVDDGVGRVEYARGGHRRDGLAVD
jgi:hypothetical protein